MADGAQDGGDLGEGVRDAVETAREEHDVPTGRAVRLRADAVDLVLHPVLGRIDGRGDRLERRGEHEGDGAAHLEARLGEATVAREDRELADVGDEGRRRPRLLERWRRRRARFAPTTTLSCAPMRIPPPSALHRYFASMGVVRANAASSRARLRARPDSLASDSPRFATSPTAMPARSSAPSTRRSSSPKASAMSPVLRAHAVATTSSCPVAARMTSKSREPPTPRVRPSPAGRTWPEARRVATARAASPSSAMAARAAAMAVSLPVRERLRRASSRARARRLTTAPARRSRRARATGPRRPWRAAGGRGARRPLAP